jgi:1,4-dihydroxy-2-naphthoyl-CoA hydrolase
MVPIERLASLDTYNLVDQQNEVAVGLEINADHLRSKSEEMVTATKTLLHRGCKPR